MPINISRNIRPPLLPNSPPPRPTPRPTPIPIATATATATVSMYNSLSATERARLDAMPKQQRMQALNDMIPPPPPPPPTPPPPTPPPTVLPNSGANSPAPRTSSRPIDPTLTNEQQKALDDLWDNTTYTEQFKRDMESTYRDMWVRFPPSPPTPSPWAAIDAGIKYMMNPTTPEPPPIPTPTPTPGSNFFASTPLLDTLPNFQSREDLMSNYHMGDLVMGNPNPTPTPTPTPTPPLIPRQPEDDSSSNLLL